MFLNSGAMRAMLTGCFRRTAVLAVAMVFGTAAQADAGSLPVMTAVSASDSFRIADTSKAETVATPLGEADVRFRALFDNWQGREGKSRIEVSVPAIDPVDMHKVRRSSGYGARSAPLAGASTNHKGVDLAAPIGTPIYATADGVVGRAQWVSGYGKLIEINHGNQIQTRYGHLSAMNVDANQRVRKGDIIGFMGSTGRSTGSHLHYEVRIAGAAVNPVAFMAPEQNSLLASIRSVTPALGGPAE